MKVSSSTRVLSQSYKRELLPCVRCGSETLPCAIADERCYHVDGCFPPVIAVDALSAISSGRTRI